MSRRLLVWPLWGLTTAVATTVCWTGVSVVTASITATHSPAIPAKEVHAALAAPSGGTPDSDPPSTLGAAPALAGAPPAIGASTATAGTRPGRTGGARPAGSEANPATAQSSGAAPVTPPDVSTPAALPPFAAPPLAPPPAPVQPPPSQPSGSSDGTHHQDGGGAPSSTTSSSTPQNQGTSPANSAPVTATFSSTGGTATVSCQGSVISLVSASPANGYTLAVRSSGPDTVDVDFNAQTRVSNVRARCSNGQPVNITDD